MTGNTRLIDTFPHAEQFNARFALSPDGQTALLYTFPAHDEPFTPQAFLINTATGATHPFTAMIDGQTAVNMGIAAATWRPGTHDLAVALTAPDPSNPDAGAWVINTDTGAATPIKSHDYVQSWSPDGATLVLSNATNDENSTMNTGITLTAANFDATGKVTLVKLTDQAVAFTFLGFIRSA